MEYDTELKNMNMCQEEKEVLEYLFKGDEIKHDDRIWFDQDEGTGVCPLIVIKFLRNEKVITYFDEHQVFECKYHLEYLPSDLFAKAMKVYKKYRKKEEIVWQEEGF